MSSVVLMSEVLASEVVHWKFVTIRAKRKQKQQELQLVVFFVMARVNDLEARMTVKCRSCGTPMERYRILFSTSPLDYHCNRILCGCTEASVAPFQVSTVGDER